jgi:pyrrolidone-carboxylate peptidase
LMYRFSHPTEATFRVPDERGWQPMHQKIDASSGEAYLKTSLPLVHLRDCLSAKHALTISDDPGRFVCNWILYVWQASECTEPLHAF